MNLKTKQPFEVLDFDIQCHRRMDSDDELVGVSATFTGQDATLVVERVTWDATVAKIWLGGGTNNVTYKVTVLIATMNGRIIETDFLVHVKDL